MNLWVDSESAGDDVFLRQATVDVPGDEADRLWLYVDKDGSGTFRGGNTEFRGVLFGPGTESTPGFELTIKNSGDYYGALVGRVDEIRNNIGLHYDEALQNTETVTATSSVPRLTFLVVTSHVVEVESD